jgi:hypothetical protein
MSSKSWSQRGAQWQFRFRAFGLLLPDRIRADPLAAGRLHHSPAPFRSILLVYVARPRASTPGSDTQVCGQQVMVWSHPKMPTGIRIWRIPLPALRLRSQGALHVRPYREVALRRHHSPTLLSTVWWLFLGLGTHHHDPHTPRLKPAGSCGAPRSDSLVHVGPGRNRDPPHSPRISV